MFGVFIEAPASTTDIRSALKKMEEGVSPSLSRNGFSFSCELGFSGSLIHSFSSAIFVSSKRKPISYGGSYLPALRESLGDGTRSHKWDNEATNSTHSADLLETTLLGLIPSRSKVGRPDLVLPPLLTDLVTTVLHALACSVLDVSCSSDKVVPKSWVPNPDLGNSSCLRLGPRIGGKATPSKSHPDVPVQRWLIKNIRSATAVAITDDAGNTDSRDAVCVSNIAVGKIVEAADPEAFIPRVAVDNLNVAGRPNMGSFRARKARIADSRIADVGLSDRPSLKILGTAPTSSKQVRFVSGGRHISSSLDIGGEDFPRFWSEYVETETILFDLRPSGTRVVEIVNTVVTSSGTTPQIYKAQLF